MWRASRHCAASASLAARSTLSLPSSKPATWLRRGLHYSSSASAAVATATVTTTPASHVHRHSTSHALTRRCARYARNPFMPTAHFHSLCRVAPDLLLAASAPPALLSQSHPHPPVTLTHGRQSLSLSHSLASLSSTSTLLSPPLTATAGGLFKECRRGVKKDGTRRGPRKKVKHSLRAREWATGQQAQAQDEWTNERRMERVMAAEVSRAPQQCQRHEWVMEWITTHGGVRALPASEGDDMHE